MRTKAQLIEQLIESHERERAAWADERKEWRNERQELLTRIQAPEQAPALAFEPNDVRHVPWDDDEAYWESQREMNGSGS
jgi:hypothetical protein